MPDPIIPLIEPVISIIRTMPFIGSPPPMLRTISIIPVMACVIFPDSMKRFISARPSAVTPWSPIIAAQGATGSSPNEVAGVVG